MPVRNQMNKNKEMIVNNASSKFKVMKLLNIPMLLGLILAVGACWASTSASDINTSSKAERVLSKSLSEKSTEKKSPKDTKPLKKKAKNSASRNKELSYLRPVIEKSILGYSTLDIVSLKSIAIKKKGKKKYLGFHLYPKQKKLHGGIRAELSVDFPYKEGDTVEYSWRFMFPKGFVTDAPANRWWVIGQWHDQPNKNKGDTWKDFPSNSPTIFLSLGKVKGKLGLGLIYGQTLNKKKSKHIGHFLPKPGKWHKVTFLIHWSTGKSGNISLFLDDKPKAILSAKGANMNNKYQHYFKLGMYRHAGIKTDNWFFVDDVKISKVKPANKNAKKNK